MKIKKPTDEDVKLGWKFNYRQLQTIQEAVDKFEGETFSLEQIDTILGYLLQNDCIHFEENS